MGYAGISAVIVKLFIRRIRLEICGFGQNTRGTKIGRLGFKIELTSCDIWVAFGKCWKT